MDPLTVVRSLQGQAGLMMGKNLKLDLVGGVGQELGCFCERTVLHAGPVDGQDVIAHMQSTTSTEGRKSHYNGVPSSLDSNFHVLIVKTSHSFHLLKKKKESFGCYRKHRLSDVKFLG